MDLSRITEFITIYAVPLIVSVSVHESAHGWMAEKFGDPTARMSGRITLNPIKHIDPFGTVLLPLMLSLIGAPVFGWAKPVPVNIYNLNKLRNGIYWVSIAGPGSNLALAVISAILLRVFMLMNPEWIYNTWMAPEELRAAGMSFAVMVPIVQMLVASVSINVLLMIFNLLPILPLDGGRVAFTLMPDRMAEMYESTAPFGIFIAVGLVSVLPATSDAFYYTVRDVSRVFFMIAGW